MYPIHNHFVRPMDYTYPETLPVGKLLAANAKLAAKALKNKNLSAFDPIVHENSCQIRALFVILHIHRVAEEAGEMEVVWQSKRKQLYLSSEVKNRQNKGSH